jgi:hypothetical protein
VMKGMVTVSAKLVVTVLAIGLAIGGAGVAGITGLGGTSQLDSSAPRSANRRRTKPFTSICMATLCRKGR